MQAIQYCKLMTKQRGQNSVRTQARAAYPGRYRITGGPVALLRYWPLVRDRLVVLAT